MSTGKDWPPDQARPDSGRYSLLWWGLSVIATIVVIAVFVAACNPPLHPAQHRGSPIGQSVVEAGRHAAQVGVDVGRRASGG